MDRTLLIQAFTDTMRCVREDAMLADATLRMQASTRLYLPGFDAILHPVQREAAPVEVMEDTTFHCARGLTDGSRRVAVLNFANAFNPGGGVQLGAMAQEECLCRSSNLYLSLTLPYLLRNYYRQNARSAGNAGTDAVIYSPGVTVFKSDDDIPVPLETPFAVDVLTCAAPYVDPEKRKPLGGEKLEALLGRRIKNILEVAVANGVDALVLGAFGCGAFNNPPLLVANCFRQLLLEEGYANCFQRVIFAIKKARGANINFEAFKQVLNP